MDDLYSLRGYDAALVSEVLGEGTRLDEVMVYRRGGLVVESGSLLIMAERTIMDKLILAHLDQGQAALFVDKNSLSTRAKFESLIEKLK